MDTVSADEAPGGQIRERVSWPKILRWLAAFAALVALMVFGYHYWRESRLFVVTEDTYVNANPVEIAALVSDTVSIVHVQDNQAVQAAVDQARIDLERTQVASPTGGTVAYLTLRPGDAVQPGTPLFTVISSHDESLSGGSGTAFSLLPPQNATGKWVKVTQRVPVRIRILDPDSEHPLRIGTTAKAKVRVAQER